MCHRSALPAARRLLLAGKPSVPALSSLGGVRTYRRANMENYVRHVSELSSERLFLLAKNGSIDGKREMMRREVMRVDKIEYEATTERVVEISEMTTAGLDSIRLPYQIGITMALFVGYVSIPLVFYFPLVEVFNHHCVTMEVPPPEDLDTILETGAWSWNWMEPPLGTISFTLLCYQWANEQKRHIGVASFEDKIRMRMGDKLVEHFPQYNSQVLRAYAESIAMVDDSPNVRADHDEIMRLAAKLS